MSSFDLLSLPEELSKAILVHWLALAGVFQLDSALCSHTQRPQFLFFAYCQRTVYEAPSSWKTSIACWSIARHAKVDGIVISDTSFTDRTNRAKFLAVNHRSLRWVSSDGNHPDEYSVVLLDVAKECRNIHDLDLQSNDNLAKPSRWDAAVLELVKVNKLKTLTLCCTVSLHGSIQVLQHCSNLLRLRLTCSLFDWDTALPPEAAIPTLTHLFTDGLISDSTLIAIGRLCSQLELLQVRVHSSRNLVTDCGVAAILNGCLLLRSSNLQIDWAGSDDLRVALAERCPVTVLMLKNWRGIDNNLAQRLLMVCPSLTKVDFAHCDWVTDDTLAACVQHCPLLESISLAASATQCTTTGVLYVIKRCGRKLRELKAAYCMQLDDTVVLAVAQHCPLLREMQFPPNISDAAITKLAESCPELTAVVLAESSISDTALLALATHCKKLSRVYVWRCANITMQGIRALALHCVDLKHVMLPSHLSNLEAEQFQKEYPHLR
jgi:hypothetical protein